MTGPAEGEPKRLGSVAIRTLMPDLVFRWNLLFQESSRIPKHDPDSRAVRSIAARAADAYFEDFPALFHMMRASIETNAEVERLLLEAEADMAADPHRSDAMLDLVDRLRKAL